MLERLVSFIVDCISTTGYTGIFLLMAIESALIPLPSEITMPFSGFLVTLGRFSLFGVAVAGALGNLAGSLVAYALGFWGQERIVRGFIRRFGKWLLLTEGDLDTSERWFRKYGNLIVFGSRLIPAVRTVISLPAGIAKMEIKRFIFYTTVGSFIWSYLLAWVGMKLGENWNLLGPWFRKFDILIVGGGLLAFFLYIRRKLNGSQLKL